MNYDQLMAALCLWREARNQPKNVMEAIWHVILNRTRDIKGRWPNTVHEVVLQHMQFSSFNMIPKPSLGKLVYVCDPNAVLFPQRHNDADWRAFQVACDVVSYSLGDDPTHSATSYEDCDPHQLPMWADSTSITAVIGPFRFYRK